MVVTDAVDEVLHGMIFSSFAFMVVMRMYWRLVFDGDKIEKES